MRLKKAIEVYRQNIEKSMKGELDYKLIGCGSLGCGCISGIKWEGMKFDCGNLTVGNYKFKLSLELGNKLEWEFNKLIYLQK